MDSGTAETSSSLAADGLAALAAPDVQRLAARMAQDGFARVFRLTLEADAHAVRAAVSEIERRARNWMRAADGDEAGTLRLVLLVAGMDQWRLAYCQAFGLNAIEGMDDLLRALRGGLEAPAEARFRQACAAIDEAESQAIDFKMEVRRNIHLALWHAMIACDDAEEARAILAALGGMLVAQVRYMPTLGWRLVADALAHIQLRCLTDAAASADLARETTQELFDVLRETLPAEIFEPMMAQANQSVVAWQQARRRSH